jgi:hypothetical protein
MEGQCTHLTQPALVECFELDMNHEVSNKGYSSFVAYWEITPQVIAISLITPV